MIAIQKYKNYINDYLSVQELISNILRINSALSSALWSQRMGTPFPPARVTNCAVLSSELLDANKLKPKKFRLANMVLVSVGLIVPYR